ncbi:TRAP transporter substrate-binding protein DctP [Marinibaculum pumilum]|uniref:TRAP transporter substrate-binding protein DctP n=1 Tax=Marinibaculum pumilum TaxID=1766165 RepID=A0ABV7L5M9_9PROT
MIRRALRGATLVLGAAVLLGTAEVSAEPAKLTYATYLPQSFTWVQVDDWFMDEVTRRTDGEVTFERYYGGTLLSALDVFPGLSSGAADLATGAPGYNPDMLPLSGVVQPYITEKADAAAKAVTDLYAQNAAFRDEWQANGMHLLYALTATENTLWTNRSVTSAEDLKGLRVRATLGIAKSLEMLGATPVAMGMNDGVQAFKSGAIDGFTSAPFDVSTLVGLQDIAKFGGDQGRMGIYAIVALAFNKQSYDALSDSAKAVIGEVAAEIPDRFLKVTDAAVDASVARIREATGLTVQGLSPAETQRWRDETAQAVWDDWTSEMEDRGLDGKQVLQQYRDLVAKYDATSSYVPGFDRVRGQ